MDFGIPLGRGDLGQAGRAAPDGGRLSGFKRHRSQPTDTPFSKQLRRADGRFSARLGWLDPIHTPGLVTIEDFEEDGYPIHIDLSFGRLRGAAAASWGPGTVLFIRTDDDAMGGSDNAIVSLAQLNLMARAPAMDPSDDRTRLIRAAGVDPDDSSGQDQKSMSAKILKNFKLFGIATQKAMEDVDATAVVSGRTRVANIWLREDSEAIQGRYAGFIARAYTKAEVDTIVQQTPWMWAQDTNLSATVNVNVPIYQLEPWSGHASEPRLVPSDEDVDDLGISGIRPSDWYIHLGRLDYEDELRKSYLFSEPTARAVQTAILDPEHYTL